MSKKLEKVLICARIGNLWNEDCFRRGYTQESADIIEVLNKQGIDTKAITFEKEDNFEGLKEAFDKYQPEIVFSDFYGNLPENPKDRSWIFDVFKKYNTPHVFAEKEVLETLYNKWLCQNKLKEKNIECLPFIKASYEDKDLINKFIREQGKVVIKPVSEYSSHGLCTSDSPRDALRKIKEIHKQFKQDSLIEKYMNGIEYQVMVIGNNDNQIILPAELIIKNNGIYTNELKNEPKGAVRKRIKNKHIEQELIELVKKIIAILGILDFTRMEIIQKDENFYPIDVNGIPFMGKNYKESPASLSQFGEIFDYGYDNLVEKIFRSAHKRYNPQ